MVSRLKDIGQSDDDDEPTPEPKRSKAVAEAYADDEDEAPSAKKPLQEIAAPEFEISKIHSGQLEFLTLVRIISDPELQARLWPRLTEKHFAADTSTALYSRLRTLQMAGKEFPKIGTLAIDPALPRPVQAQLSAFVARAEKGTLASEIQLTNGQMVPVSTAQDFETYVFDFLESYRVTRSSWELVLDVTNQIADDQEFDPLVGPALFETAAAEILNLRGKESIQDAITHYGYGLTDQDNAKRQSEVLKTFATDKLRFKTGFATYDERAGGFQPGEVILIGANTGGGKCIVKGSLVLTSNGIVKIEDLSSQNCGYAEKVISVAGINGIEQTSHVYKEVVTETWAMKTALGFSNTSTAAHRVWALVDGRPEWVHQKDLKPGDSLVVLTGQRLWGQNLDLPPPDRALGLIDVAVPERMTADLARFLGYMVSEGHFGKGSQHHISFTNYDAEVMEDFLVCASNVFPEEVLRPAKKIEDRSAEVRFTARVQLIAWLEAVGLQSGVSRDQEVPWSIRQAPEPIVVEFLRALFEGDGYIQQDDKKQVFFTTTSKNLHDQVKVILLNLGIVSNTVEQTKHATNGKPGNSSRVWTMIIGHRYVDVFADRVGFISSRKKSELSACLQRGQRSSVGRKTEYLLGAESLFSAAWDALNTNRTVAFTKLCAGGLNLSNSARNAVDRRSPTKTSAKALLTLMEAAGLDGHPTVAPLRFLAREDVVIDTVVEVERKEGVEEVFDFVVPGTHSFCANGLVQHNTALALSLMKNMAGMGTSVAMLQLELTNAQVNERISANLADIDSEVIRSGKLSDKQKRQIIQANEDFHEELKASRSRFTVFAPSSSTIQECEYAFKTFNYKVWFIDYINLLKWEGGGSHRSGEDWTRLSDIVKEFKRLAKKYGIAVVLAVQVNVDKESGDIEIRYAKAMKEHADVVLVWNLTKQAREEGVVWLRHLKARQYEPFDFPVRVVLEHCRFESVNMAIQPKTEERKLGAKKRVKESQEPAPPQEDTTFTKKAKPLAGGDMEMAQVSEEDDSELGSLLASVGKRPSLLLDDEDEEAESYD